jgi:DNA-binding NarL/FixJ family response regulator
VTRVLLFFDQFLLACAVESILMQEADLTIFKHTPGASPLLTDVERFRPNVIITDAAKLEQANLGLLDLIRGPLALRILFVADDEDLVLALEKKEIPIRGSYDLIQAIRS